MGMFEYIHSTATDTVYVSTRTSGITHELQLESRTPSITDLQVPWQTIDSGIAAVLATNLVHKWHQRAINVGLQLGGAQP